MIGKLIQRLILRDLARNWVRSVITILGIALGVSVYLSIMLANHTALDRFKQTVDEVSGKANLEISPRFERSVPETLLGDLQWIWQVGGTFTPVIDEIVSLPEGRKEVVQLLGIDMLGDKDLRSFSTIQDGNSNEASTGKESETAKEGADNSTSILRPRAAFVGSKLAKQLNLKDGSSFALLINDKNQNLHVAGVLSGEGLGGAFSGNLVVTDIAVAQSILNMPGKISRIQIMVPENILPAVTEKLAAEIPKTLTAMRPSARGQQVEKMTRSFEYNLLALTFIALMVGMFLIYSTMTIAVIRRRQEIGTLRALGIGKRQILSCFLLEALLLASAGTALGVLFGLGLADGALKAVSSTIQHFYVQHPVESVNWDWLVIAQSAAVGIILTVGAALPAVFEATSIAPAEATRRASFESKAIRKAKMLALIACALAILGWFASLQPALSGFPIFGYVAAFLAIAAAALFVPMLMKLFLPAASSVLHKLIPGEGRLAARSLYGTLGRSSVAVASLMIGIAMMVSLAIMIGSFRQTVTVWVNQTLEADLWLQSAARAHGSPNALMKAEVVDQIKRTPGVAAVDGFVEMPFEYEGFPTNIGAGDLDVVAKYGRLLFTSGENTLDVLRAIDDRSCIVSETFAIRRNVRKGQTITIETPSGPASFLVKGVYYDYASDLGFIIIPRPVFNRLFKENGISSCAIYIAPGQNADDVRSRIFNNVKSLVLIRTTGELRREAMRVFDRTFAITYALHTIAIAIAMLSIMNSLFALTLESKREFGILRYLGSTAAQLKRMVLIQAGLLGLFGNVTGLALGFVLSLLLIHVINKQSFGWTVQFTVPYDFLVQSSIAVLITAFCAGILPARLAAKTPAPEVVREE